MLHKTRAIQNNFEHCEQMKHAKGVYQLVPFLQCVWLTGLTHETGCVNTQT